MAELASNQEGLITPRQMRELGITKRQQERLVRNRWIHRCAPGVYAIAGSPRTHRQMLRLGLLALDGKGCVGFEAAATLHQLDRSDPEAIEFLVPRHVRHRELPFTVHSSKFIGPLDIISVAGFRATSATRTIIDLALTRPRRIRLEAAIDSAVRLGLSSPVVLARRLETLRGSGRWGCRTIDRLLEDSGGHSPLERRFLALVRRAGLPRPRTQVVHRKKGKHVARVDFLFDEHDVVIEVTGRLGHSSPSERARDAQRRNELQDLGRKVYEFTWAQVTHEGAWVIERLRAYLTLPASDPSPSA